MFKNIGVVLTIAALALSIMIAAPGQLVGASETVNTEEENFWGPEGTACPRGQGRIAEDLDEEEYEEWIREREEFREERQNENHRTRSGFGFNGRRGHHGMRH